MRQNDIDNLFFQYRAQYELTRPLPQLELVKPQGWRFWLFTMQAIASILLSSARTATIFYDAAASSAVGFGLPPDLTTGLAIAEAMLSVGVIEVFLIAAVIERTLGRKEAKRVSARWLNFGFLLAMAVALLANLFVGLSIVPDIPSYVVDAMSWITGVLVGISATLLVAVSGEVIGEILLAARFENNRRRETHTAAVHAWNEKFRTSWNSSKGRLLRNLASAPVSATPPWNPTPAIVPAAAKSESSQTSASSSPSVPSGLFSNIAGWWRQLRPKSRLTPLRNTVPASAQTARPTHAAKLVVTWALIFILVIAAAGAFGLAINFGSQSPLPTSNVVDSPNTISASDSTVKHELPDGGTVFLAPQSELELTLLASAAESNSLTLLTLLKGKVLVFVSPGANDVFFVQTPTGIRGQVVGSIMGMTFEPETNRVEIDCLEGHCALENTSNGGRVDRVELQAGEGAVVEQNTSPVIGEIAAEDGWQAIADIEIPPPSESPSNLTSGETAASSASDDSSPNAAAQPPTSNDGSGDPASALAATAESASPDQAESVSVDQTESVSVDQTEEAGSTPSAAGDSSADPSTPTPNVAATLVVFCDAFQAEFPGTPCP